LSMTAINELGRKYARLEVIARADNVDKKAAWVCLCDCGNETIALGTQLRTGSKQSCGCYHKEVVSETGKRNAGRTYARGKPPMYEDYDGELGKCIGTSNRTERNGGVIYLIQCSECNEVHERNAKHLKQGVRSRDCKYTKPPNWTGLDRWDAIIRRTYGITYEEYEQMVEDQGGGCAICGKTESEEGRRLPIDHCHTTGKVRGVLCAKCNQALGMFRDDPELLRNAAQYLEK